MMSLNFIGHMAVEVEDQSKKRQNIRPKQFLFTEICQGERSLWRLQETGSSEILQCCARSNGDGYNELGRRNEIPSNILKLGLLPR